MPIIVILKAFSLKCREIDLNYCTCCKTFIWISYKAFLPKHSNIYSIIPRKIYKYNCLLR